MRKNAKINVDKYRMPTKYDRRRKASDEDRAAMRRLWAAGIPQDEIAEIFGMSQTGVSYIVNDQARANLAAYRKGRPQKIRTTEEARHYKRELRAYKKGVYVREREEAKMREEKGE